MLNIKIICVGYLKEDFYKKAEAEFVKRLSKYCKLEIIEIEDEKLNLNNMSQAEADKIKEIECNKIIQKIDKFNRCKVIALDLNGHSYSSEKLASKLQNIALNESSTIIFIIGGSLGLTQNLLNKCDEKISFSSLTFPHQLIRIFLLEQIFRCFKINNNETYHH
ncbi:MAG: 23S rRNA (pseudouridine(1915)-N(3))-methyltransferase RlmH [Clostridia bacterium]|nr:23S rRNA (pseudouridine(1915)-N(3))-methyltransferase RlmH [Clostridia bacterium]